MLLGRVLRTKRPCGGCRWWKSWWKAFVRVESLLPREFVSAFIFLFSIFRWFFGVSCFLIRVEIFHYFPRTCSKYRRRVRFAPRDGRRWPRHVGVLTGCSSFRALRKRKSNTASTAGSGEQQSEQRRGFAPGCFRKQDGQGVKSLEPCVYNCLKVRRLVQELLSVEKWQSDYGMLQCAADDYASTMHEADIWCRLGRYSG